MKIKDQIKVRRQQLGISVNELAQRMGVSSQSIRHWESGRSYPGKGKTNDLETALSCALDWSEGAHAQAKGPQLQNLIDPGDVGILLGIARLPPPAKALVADLVEMYAALSKNGSDFVHRSRERGTAFHATETEQLAGEVGIAQAKPKKQTRAERKPPPKRHSTRRKAA